MDIITAQDEYALLMDQDANPCAAATFITRPLIQWHPGYADLLIKAKQQLPDHKIVVRLYLNMCTTLDTSGMRRAKFDPDTGVKLQVEGTLTSRIWDDSQNATVQEAADWFETNCPGVVDYLIVFTYADNQRIIDLWPDKPELLHLAEYLCMAAIDFDNLHKPYDEIAAEADQIMVDEELVKLPHILDVNMIRMNLIAALTQEPCYRVKISGAKDAYVDAAKRWVYENYSTQTSVLSIEPMMNPETGLPYFGRIGGLDLTEAEKLKIKTDMEKWKTKKLKETFAITPKWLKGKTYEQLDYELPDGKKIILGRIV